MKSRFSKLADGRRRGAVMVMVLVCAMVALVIFASIVRLAAAGRRITDQQSRQVQATWLAESGLERAAWRLAADADYTGETWTISAEEFEVTDATAVKIAVVKIAVVKIAVVKIEVQTIPEQPNRRLVSIRADYPDHPQHRSRQSKQAVVQLAP